jgi:microcystin-dependent protein
MSEPFLAEICIVGFNFAPRGYAFCDGQLLPINQNQSLYSLVGTTYGGDGESTFALPDLRGRTPIHVGSSNGTSHTLGERSGEEAHPLTIAEMASHGHPVNATTAPAGDTSPAGQALSTTAVNAYRTTGPLVAMSTSAVADSPVGQGHPNMQPLLALNFCIALSGLFPSRN